MGIAYLVKVGLQVVNLLALLQETGPELLLELLLAQHHLNSTVGVVDFAVLGVDLGIELQLGLVCDTLAGITSEGDGGGGELELGLLLRDLGGLDAHVEVVALGIIGG